MSAILLCQCLICKHVKIVLAEKPEWVYIESNVMLAEKEEERNDPMAESTALATTQSQNQISFAPRSLQEAFQFADMVLESGMAPKAYLEIFKGKTGDEFKKACGQARSAVVVAVQFGLEVGFQPLQALQCIANINGNPSVWGDGALALVMSSGLLETIKEDDFDAIKTNKKATCIVKRRGDPQEKVVTFSYEDAKTAGIFDRGVWRTYPYRMCLMRARAFALRDKFPDVLKGLKIAEEVMDYDIDVPPPSQPKPQGQIAVPTVDAKTTLAEVLLPAKDEKPAEEKPQEAVENQDADPAPEDDPEVRKALEEEARAWATEYYQSYKAHSTKEQSLAFLQKHFQITDSRQVPSDQREFAMAQAKQGFPCMKESQ